MAMSCTVAVFELLEQGTSLALANTVLAVAMSTVGNN